MARNDSSPGLEEEAFKTGEVTIETPNQTSFQRAAESIAYKYQAAH